mgnify:CR=1 FL=1
MKAFLAVDKKKRAEWASDNFINIRWGMKYVVTTWYMLIAVQS